MEIPEGWKLVPVVPTNKMLKAGYEALRKYLDSLPIEERERRFGLAATYPSVVFTNHEKFTARWMAMLAASPDYETLKTRKKP